MRRNHPWTGARGGLAGLVFAACVAGCADPSGDDAGRAQGWTATQAREVLDLAARDRKVREGFGPETVADTAFMGRMARADSANTRRLKALVDSLGWPTGPVVGDSVLEGAFLLVQHATDPPFQQSAAGFLESEVKAGRLDVQDYVLFVDRTRQKRGLLQLYGTQISIVPGSRTATLDPIEDSAEVDVRRGELGLPSLGRYLEAVERQTGFAIAGFDPSTARGDTVR